MKRSELEQMIREELEEGFMSSFRKGKARGKHRGLKRRGLIKDPLTPGDVLDIPGGSDKDELTWQRYGKQTMENSITEEDQLRHLQTPNLEKRKEFCLLAA